MEKLGLVVKEILENKIKEGLRKSDSAFLINYSKLSSPDLCSLRQSLKHVNADLFVIKNSIARRALKGAGLEFLIKSIEGSCGLVFIKDEQVSVSRVLTDFLRDHPTLKLQGGFLKDKAIKDVDIEALAKLPSKEALRAKVVGALNAPIAGLVITLNATIRKLVYCLEQVKNKKGTK
jgi:large subunit ribosomal protein L10